MKWRGRPAWSTAAIFRGSPSYARHTTFDKSHRAAAFEGACERHLIGVVEVAADRQAVREARGVDAERRQEPREIQRRRLAFGIRVRRDDDLADAFRLDALEQLLHLELVDADAFHRRDEAAEHVVAAAEAHRALDRVDVFRLADDAEHRAVALRIATDRARIFLGQRKASAA